MKTRVVRLVVGFIIGLPLLVAIMGTFGLSVYLIGTHYLGDGIPLTSWHEYAQPYVDNLNPLELLSSTLEKKPEAGTEEILDVPTALAPTMPIAMLPTAMLQTTDVTVENVPTRDGIKVAQSVEATISLTSTRILTSTRALIATATPEISSTPTAPPLLASTSTSTSTTLARVGDSRANTQQLTLITSTLTPAAVFAQATAAKVATERALAQEPVVPTGLSTALPLPATPPARPVVVDIADIPALTAIALEQSALATVAAILTRVDNPDFTFAEFTPTPTPIVITATPTPDDIFAAATAAAVRTYQAVSVGTSTPTPMNWKVVTPVYVLNTPTPANAATAAYQSALATAYVVTTGTPDPYRHVVVVELITATPVATSLVAAAQTVAAAEWLATSVGTATATPKNWRVITPIVVTATATPANALTAQAQLMKATAAAVLTATPPWDQLVVTATATPPFVAINNPIELLNLSHRSPAYTFPSQLLGKILFRSDVSGREEIYAINSNGTGLALLPDNRAYRLAEGRDAFSADGLSRAYAKRDPHNRLTQIYYENFEYGSQRAWSAFGTGVAWAPAWSPTAQRIAFVSNESGNDELWVMEKDQWPAIQVTHNSWEWDLHPSWSPDGNTIVFASNRIEGNRQLWLMDADGGNQRQLTGFDLPLAELGHLFSNLVFEAWDPVWVKYPDPYIRMSRESILARPDCQVCILGQ